MTTKEVLIKARALVEKGWTKGAGARRANGASVYPDDNEACRWCILGAVNAAEYHDRELRLRAITKLKAAIPKAGIADFNDDPATTHADVLAAFDRAIAECEK